MSLDKQLWCTPCSPHLCFTINTLCSILSQTPDRETKKTPHLILWLCTAGTSDLSPKGPYEWGCKRGLCKEEVAAVGLVERSGLILVRVWWEQIEQDWADVWGCVMVVAEAEVRLIWEETQQKTRGFVKRDIKVQRFLMWWSKVAENVLHPRCLWWCFS